MEELTTEQRVGDELTAEAGNLLSLSDQLADCTSALREATHEFIELEAERESASLSSEPLACDPANPDASAAGWVVREREKLQEAWTELEAEQRRQAINGGIPAIPGATSTVASEPTLTERVSESQDAGVAPDRASQPAMDKSQQFRFLQQEYDRRRD